MSLTPLQFPVSSGRKILFVSHEATRTGAPMFLLHFLRWLRRNTKFEFELLLGKGGPLEKDFAAVAKVHTSAEMLANPRRIQSFALIYSNTACNGNLLEELQPGNVPVITHVHELDMGYHWLGARNMGGVVSQSNYFIACAEAVASRLRQVFNIPADRISVHYEMIDGNAVTTNATAAGAELRRQYDIPEDAWVVSACGTFDFRKAPDLFLQVAARLHRTLGKIRPLRFLWIGSLNSPDLVRLLREDVRKLGLEGVVQFIGELPSPHGLLALSDAFCLTSREDPFPLIMLEAALLKRPVLCFEGAGGAGEFCALEGGIAVPYLDTDAMAAKVAELLQDLQQAARIGLRASEVVQDRFVIEKIAPGLWKELEGLLGRGLTQRQWRGDNLTFTEIYASWNMAEAPQRSYLEAHLKRAETRKAARAFVAAGRTSDAIGLLVRTVNEDVASKDPLIIFESLVEIGDALKQIEPKRSAHLLGEADRIARGNPYLKLDLFRRQPAAAGDQTLVPINPAPESHAVAC